MPHVSNFRLNNITVGDLMVLEMGTIICHTNELTFLFHGFSIKMSFTKNDTKDSNGAYELDSTTTPPTLRCFNFNNPLGTSTTEPFEIAKFTPRQQQIAIDNNAKPEALYIAFSIATHGTTKIVNYTFYSKII